MISDELKQEYGYDPALVPRFTILDLLDQLKDKEDPNDDKE
jgi:hypothetical protein